MQVSVRSYLNAGVAVVGASAIALSPVSPVNPALNDIQLPESNVSSQAVALSATVNPLLWYNEVLQSSATNALALIDQFALDPAPILSAILARLNGAPGPAPVDAGDPLANLQILASQTQTYLGKVGAYLPTAVSLAFEAIIENLSAGDVSGALNQLLELPIEILGTAAPSFAGAFQRVQINLGPVLIALQKFTVSLMPDPTLQAVANAIFGVDFLGNPTAYNLMFTAGGITGPLMSGIGSIGTAFQDVIDAAQAANPIDVVNAIVNIPATIVDGVLNGGYGPGLHLPFVGGVFPGVLTGPFNVIVGNLSGTVKSLLDLSAVIAGAISPSGYTPLSTQSTVDEGARITDTNIGGTNLVSLQTGTGAAGNQQAKGQTERLAEDEGAVGGGEGTLSPPSEDAGEETEGSGTETPDEGATSTGPVAEGAGVTPESESEVQSKTRGAVVANVSTPNKVTPSTRAGTVRKPGERVGTALQSFGDQIDKTVNKFGDGVKKALTGKKADKANSTGSDSGASTGSGSGAGAGGSSTGGKHRAAA